MKLRFAGAPITFTRVANGESPYVLGRQTGTLQSLYDATLFGTGGTIEKSGVRLHNGSQAKTVQNVTIFTGSPSKTALSLLDTYASNMDGQTLVYSGSLPVPLGGRPRPAFTRPPRGP